MRHDDHRLAARMHFLEQRHHPRLVLTVQGTRGFVREDELRVVRQCSCDRHPLALPAGQLGEALP